MSTEDTLDDAIAAVEAVEDETAEVIQPRSSDGAPESPAAPSPTDLARKGKRKFGQD